MPRRGRSMRRHVAGQRGAGFAAFPLRALLTRISLLLVLVILTTVACNDDSGATNQDRGGGSDSGLATVDIVGQLTPSVVQILTASDPTTSAPAN